MLKLGFIGAGTVGTALSVRLSSKGYQVVAVSSRSQTSARNLAEAISGCRAFNNNQDVADTAEVIFITTPDDAIAPVASQIQWRTGQGVVHCSGADSTDILEPAKKSGAEVGVFHPLQTFASVSQAIENIPGSTFVLEAEEPLLNILKEMASALDGNWVELKAGDKVIYHAAAVIACNYMVTLVKLASDLWQTFHVSPHQATQALLPLLRGTINNIDTVGIPQCLTGPIARGDTGTVKKHLKALQEKAPAILSTYRELGLQTIPIALAKGRINQHQAQQLQAILKQADQQKSIKGGSPVRIMLKSKIHRARVTKVNIDYEGSITIDKKLMEEADILPYEQVQVLDINNGARFTTYAIGGESGEIGINGAAARLVAEGDTIIILSYCYVTEDEARSFSPKLICVDAENAIIETKPMAEAISFRGGDKCV